MINDLSYFLDVETLKRMVEEQGESSKDKTTLQDFTPHELLTALLN